MKTSSRAMVAATVLSAALGLSAAPAQGADLRFDDLVGDAYGGGLDVTSVTLKNRDRVVVAKVGFAANVRGRLLVSLDTRGGRGVTLGSTRGADGKHRDRVYSAAFTDKAGTFKKLSCRGFKVTWNDEANLARLRLPSRCLTRGNYGAVNSIVLTERISGGDVDLAPDERGNGGLQSSDWVARG